MLNQSLYIEKINDKELNLSVYHKNDDKHKRNSDDEQLKWRNH